MGRLLVLTSWWQPKRIQKTALLKSKKSQEHVKDYNIYIAKARGWNQPHPLQQYSILQGQIEFLPVQPQLPMAS